MDHVQKGMAAVSLKGDDEGSGEPKLCEKCQTIIDNMFLADSQALPLGGGMRMCTRTEIQPAFLDQGPGTATCPLCVFLEGACQSLGYIVPADPRLRNAMSVGFTSFSITDPAGRHEKQLEMIPISQYLSDHNTHIGQTTTSESTGSIQTANYLKAMLRDCSGNHQQCSQILDSEGCKWWPSRLLDLACVPEGIIRLVQPESIAGEEYDYAVLSYRWGQDPTFKKLTMATIEEFCIGLVIESLPATFRDAISATRSLGLRYLWIDALCIIQDSEKDWQEEASRMAQIYGRSFVNLAATSSTDAEGGLFRTRYATLLQGCRGIFPKYPSYQGVLGEEHICLLSDWWTQIEWGPLNSRGWVFQERLLSPRTAHFTSSQVFWECRELAASEDYPSGQPSIKGFKAIGSYPGLTGKMVLPRRPIAGHQPSVTPTAAYSAWYELSSRYSATDLTVQGDRLMALSGIVEAIKQVLPDDEEYLAGLWRSRLLWDIFWSGSYRLHPASIKKRSRPSWSWASVSALGSWTSQYIKELREAFPTPRAEVLEAKVFPKGNPLGSVEGGLLRIRGRMCRATITVARSINDTTSVEVNGNNIAGISVHLAEEPLDTFEVVLVEIFTVDEIPTGDHFKLTAGLVLYPTGAKDGTFYLGTKFKIDYWDMKPSLSLSQQIDSMRALDKAFGSCNLGPGWFKDFDGVDKYTVTII